MNGGAAVKTIHEILETPVADETDVLVCGGGPAGFGAAVAAARAGARTLLLEESNCLGGMATAGMMSHWSGCESSPLGLEITERMRRSAVLPPGWTEDKRWCCSHEALKQAMFEMAADAGVRVLLHAHVADAVVEGGTVKGAIAESKSGREAFLAAVTVDATGDGDVAARAGAAFDLGRPGDHGCQPATLMFLLGGVDTARAIFPPSFETLVDVPRGEIQSLGRAHLPSPAGHVLLYPTRLPGCVCVNMTNATGVDATDARSVTRAEIECRAQIEPIVAFLREFAPGYETCFALSSAQNVGIRESRHFRGVYTLTEEDIVEGRSFDDWIAVRNFFNFDIHNVGGAGLDPNGAQKHFQAKGTYQIPYRCCVPEKLDGLLLAGRNISGTHKAHSNFRVMTICADVGYGAGTAAALAAKAGVRPRDADVAAVQRVLRAAGFEP